jgi:hypothetical protein
MRLLLGVQALHVGRGFTLAAGLNPVVSQQNLEAQGYLDTLSPEDRVLLLEWIKQFAQRLALKVRR